MDLKLFLEYFFKYILKYIYKGFGVMQLQQTGLKFVGGYKAGVGVEGIYNIW